MVVNWFCVYEVGVKAALCSASTVPIQQEYSQPPAIRQRIDLIKKASYYIICWALAQTSIVF